jgi:FixJ family two-component response regulator
MELTVRQAEAQLIQLSMTLRELARRDRVLLDAVESGVPKARIARLSGVSRTTVDRVIARDNAT